MSFRERIAALFPRAKSPKELQTGGSFVPSNFGLSPAAPTVVVAEQVYQMPAERRRQRVNQQMEFFDYLFEKHQINIEHYYSTFFEQASRPIGGRISTIMGPLYESLSDGSFVPNPMLGERWGDERDPDFGSPGYAALPVPPSWFIEGKAPPPRTIFYDKGSAPK